MKPGYAALSHVDGKMHGGSTQSDPAWCTHGVNIYRICNSMHLKISY